jgi:hypothetical protein
LKRLVAVILATSFFIGAPLRAQESGKAAQAEQAAAVWLALVDAADYGRSWEQGAALFQGAVSKPAWIAAARSARTPLGAVVSRTLQSAEFSRTLPGAPDGEYVVVTYQTEFAHKASAIETVTPAHQPDGSWKICGYFIK